MKASLFNKLIEKFALLIFKNAFILKYFLAKEGTILEYTSDKLKDNFNIVMASVQNDGLSFQYASDKLKDNELILLTALNNIHRDGVFKGNWGVNPYDSLISIASDRLKDDKETMLKALNLRPYGLKYVSERLKADKDFILTFVKKDWRLFQFAADKLKEDIPFCIECAKINTGVINYFKGKADLLFSQFNTVEQVEQHLLSLSQQEKTLQEQNNQLLLKIEKNVVNTTVLFKRKLF